MDPRGMSSRSIISVSSQRMSTYLIAVAIKPNSWSWMCKGWFRHKSSHKLTPALGDNNRSVLWWNLETVQRAHPWYKPLQIVRSNSNPLQNETQPFQGRNCCQKRSRHPEHHVCVLPGWTTAQPSGNGPSPLNKKQFADPLVLGLSDTVICLAGFSPGQWKITCFPGGVLLQNRLVICFSFKSILLGPKPKRNKTKPSFPQEYFLWADNSLGSARVHRHLQRSKRCFQNHARVTLNFRRNYPKHQNDVVYP